MVNLCWMDLVLGAAATASLFLKEKTRNYRSWWSCCFEFDDDHHHHHRRRRQHQCKQKENDILAQETTRGNFSSMASCCCCKISPIIPIFVFFLLVSSSICPVYSSETGDLYAKNQTFRPEEELMKLKIIRERLNKINKPAAKTIQSPDGDIIDCVLLHHQPAFDHPQLKGQKPFDPPERPAGHNPNGMAAEDFQLWRMSGESCPEGTIPIRRTTEQDMLRASSVRRFGRKPRRRVRRDSTSNGHEVASLTNTSTLFV